MKRQRFRVSDIGDGYVDIEGKVPSGWSVLCTWKMDDWLDWTGILLRESGEIEFEIVPVKKKRRKKK